MQRRQVIAGVDVAGVVSLAGSAGAAAVDTAFRLSFPKVVRTIGNEGDALCRKGAA